MYYQLDETGAVLHGGFNCEQTFPTVWLSENDPRVLAMLAKVQAERRQSIQPAMEDIVAVLTPVQQTALRIRLDARK